MQRLDGERHIVGAGVREDGGDAVFHHAARACDIARAFRQAAHHQDQAFGAECGRFVDRALVVVDRGLPPGLVRCRKHPAAAIAADFHAVVLDRANGRFKADGADLVAPRIDRGNAVPCAGFDRFAQIPLLAHRRKIDGEA